MRTLSSVDPAADVACTLPLSGVKDRLTALQVLIGGRLDGVTRVGDRLSIRIERRGDDDALEARAAAWAQAEKGCCAFLGFAIESDPRAVTLEIVAPTGAEPTLDGIGWIVRAAGRQGAP